MNVREAKQAVADAGRELLQERLVARTWGNVSCRTGKQSFVITPSGLAYEGMTAEDVVEYNMATGRWSGMRKPSSEKGIHAAAYARFPDAGFVIHTHQTYASALGLAGFDPKRLTDEEREALGGAAVSGYGLPGTKRLRNNVYDALDTGAHTVLMTQHGALVVGRDRKEAFERAKRLEQICKAVCRGQPEEEPSGDAASLAALASRVQGLFPCVTYTAAPAVLETSRMVRSFRAQLDDMAQMIGPKLVSVAGEPEAVERALGRCPAVLVKGAGAICRANSQEDCEALKLLTEKACAAFLHTRKLGVPATLSTVDTLLMRVVYQKKYSQKMRG